jgi:hypothetical protein
MFQPPVKEAEDPAGNEIRAEKANNDEGNDDNDKPKSIIPVYDIAISVFFREDGQPTIYRRNKPVNQVNGYRNRGYYQEALQKILEYLFPLPPGIGFFVFHNIRLFH